MAEHIAEFLINLPKELVVFILSAMPISELRGALPLAIAKFEFPIIKAYSIAVVGNILPVIPIILFLDKIRALLRHIPFMDKFFNWLYARTERRSGVVEKYGPIGLIIFVAIPLPITGAWTGSVAALLFRIKMRYALPAILSGVMIAGVIVTLLTVGVSGILSGGIFGN